MTKTQRLNQVLAVEKGVKETAYKELSELHKLDQKVGLFTGASRHYAKKSDDGEDLPSEGVKVQLVANDVLDRVSTLLTELFDVTLTKDQANRSATADVVVDGNVLCKDVPATYLLFLEKQLTDVRTFITKMPTLDSAEDWTFDPNARVFKSSPATTHRTKKIQKPLVMYPATERHPAQTQLITEDEVVGYWTIQKMSGALPAPRKQKLLARVEKLLAAVKSAREEANTVNAPDAHVGSAVFNYLLAD